MPSIGAWRDVVQVHRGIADQLDLAIRVVRRWLDELGSDARCSWPSSRATVADIAASRSMFSALSRTHRWLAA